MTRKNKSTLGTFLMVMGVILIILTAGRVDWEKSIVGINPNDVLPFWQIVLQGGGGGALVFIGNRLREKNLCE